MGTNRQIAVRQQQEPSVAKIQGEHTNAQELQGIMEWAKHNANLVAPSPAVGTLPEGFAVSLSVIHVDPQSDDVYDVGGGKLGLSKSPLQRISTASGVSWDAQMSRRLDDGSDPHYCHYRAVGSVEQFDGTELQIVGDKEMDLRSRSAQVETLWERYHAAKAQWDSGRSRRKYPPKEPTGQIREMRLHLLSHAQTKAQLRAIRSLGVKTGYSSEELAKPFVIARLMFTGRSSDPALQRELSMMVAARHLGGRRALYGGSPDQPYALSPPRRVHQPPPVAQAAPAAVAEHPPPPVSSDSNIVDEPPDSDPAPAAPAPQQQSSAGPSGLTIPFGDSRGTPIEDADDKDLEWCVKAIATKLASGESPPRFRAGDEALVAGMRAELDRRRGVEEPPADYDRGPDPEMY